MRSSRRIPIKGGANGVKTKVTNFTGSTKHAAQTKIRNVSFLKSAVDELKRKLDKCKKKIRN